MTGHQRGQTSTATNGILTSPFSCATTAVSISTLTALDSDASVAARLGPRERHLRWRALPCRRGAFSIDGHLLTVHSGFGVPSLFRCTLEEVLVGQALVAAAGSRKPTMNKQETTGSSPSLTQVLLGSDILPKPRRTSQGQSPNWRCHCPQEKCSAFELTAPAPLKTMLATPLSRRERVRHSLWACRCPMTRTQA
jgi:hypothetical protein